MIRCGVALALTLLTWIGSALAAEHTVEQQGRAFNPGALKAQVGDTVQFVNNDAVTHNVYSESAAATFNLGAQKPGRRMAVTLKKPGKVEVECEIHPKMLLVIEVQDE